jgi:DNA mismatch endonuclease (patch repair protein)
MKRKGLPAFRPPSSDRSRNMRAIRSTANATTEKRLISLLLRRRLRGWRVRPKDIPGTPDFVFPRSHLAIFCDGCFFHGCPKCGHIPKTNVAYWRAKILRNRRRDAKVSRKLRSLGYSVIRIWECQLRKRPTSSVMRICQRLKATSSASIAC